MPPKKMLVESFRLDELRDPKKNPRSHSPENIAAIEQSLRAHGQVYPILVRKKDQVIIHGNGTVAAMRKIGWTSCRVVILDVDKTEAAALTVRLNRTGELSTWDLPTLSQMVTGMADEGVDIATLGWSEADLDRLTASMVKASKKALKEIADFVPDSFPQLTEAAATVAPAEIENESGGDRPTMGRPINMTREQREVFDLAWARMREQHADDGPELSQGRCCEFLSAEFLAGV